MRKNNKLKIGILLALALSFLVLPNLTESQSYYSNSYSSYSSSMHRYDSSVQYTQPSFQQQYSMLGVNYGDFWPILNQRLECKSQQDFILAVRPGGCSPSVVRSDLLEEQNVPVFCKIDAIKLNPLIDVASIKSVRFSGNNKDIAGISFHPSQAALRIYNPVLDSPLINDVGYVVVNLKKKPSERNISKVVSVNLTAVLYYDLTNVFGTGKGSYYLPVLTDADWNEKFRNYAFWKGKGYLRANWVEKDKAEISIYLDKDQVYRKITLTRGQTSEMIYFPGFYCSGGLQLRLADSAPAELTARLQIDNDEQTLTQNENFLENNCVITRIDSTGVIDNVYLRCRGKTYLLSVSIQNKILLQKGGYSYDVDLGAKVNDVYPVFIGKDSGKFFILLVKNLNKNYFSNDKILPTYLDRVNNIYRSLDKSKTDWRTQFENKVKSILGNAEVKLVYQGASILDHTFVGLGKLQDKTDSDLGLTSENYKKLNDYFEATRTSTYELVDNYQDEKDENGEYLGALALSELADSASKLYKPASEAKILSDLVDRYPNSPLAKMSQLRLDDLSYYDYTKASAQVQIDYQSYYVKLLNVNQPDLNDASAEFSVDSESITKRENDIVYQDSYSREYLKLLKLEEDYALVEYYHKGPSVNSAYRTTTTNSRTEYVKDIVNMNFYNNFVVGDKNVVLKKINLKRSAVVQLLSKIPSGTTTTNFSLSIPIEKRNIQLNPDKTAERIKNLNKSIEKWTGIVNKMGNVVKTWKGACLATSTSLIVKNLFTNLGGKSIARQTVMNNYWKTYCANEVNKAKDAGVKLTIDGCYAKYTTEIENSVNKVEAGIKDMNSKLSSISNKNNISGEFSKEFKSFVKANKQLEIGEGKNLGSVFGDNSDETIDKLVGKGELNIEQMRDIMMYGKLSSDTTKGVGTVASSLFKNQVSVVEQSANEQKTIITYSSAVKNLGANIQSIGTKNVGTKEYIDVSKLTAEQASKLPGASAGDEFIIINTPLSVSGRQASSYKSEYAGKVIYIPLKDLGNGNYNLNTKNGYILNEDGRVNSVINSSQLNSEIVSKLGVGSFVKISRGTCENKYSDPKLSYFEREPNKGTPEVVPLDLNRGWYAATKQTYPGIGKSTTQAGAVTSLWLCNIGKNGREDWGLSASDDLCIQVNYDTGQPLDQLGCITGDEAKKLALAAKSIFESASSQYGKKTVKLNLLSGSWSTTPKPAVSSAGTECIDFMSPSDCKLLFNVCDPVICPSSRCDFGGSFPVDDVIQSGIVGSIFLCMPNFVGFGGDVYVPVCLSGLQAGLDAYVSVLKSHRDCLQENLKTGKMTGICDEIYSIYLCEFFWRQVSPLMDIAIPKLIEYVYTGGQMQTRGGGEYATVQEAWDNAKNSASYFTNYYGLNAFKAFQVKSTAEIGTQVCKGFISTNLPTSAEGLDKLLEPESPVQFYARFDETLFSEATVPSTSQYKVYYHIYAGKDSGHYYQIYLKNPPQTGTYSAQQTIVVDSGYVGIGQTIDIAKDFTAPSSYKELCVRIDSKDECGFKQVSTSFAVNYLKDLAASEQVSEKISTEKECISGTPSLYSLANPNLQAGAENTVQPAIYKNGLIRVCSKENPGGNTQAERWTNVGSCGTGISCWLDTDSVKNVIYDTQLEKKALSDSALIASSELAKQGLLTETQLADRIALLKQNYGNIKLDKLIITDYLDNPKEVSVTKEIFSDIDDIKKKSSDNYFSAQANLYESRILNKLSNALSVVLKLKLVSPVVEKIAIPSGGVTTSSISTPKDTGQKIGGYSVVNYQDKLYYLVDDKGDIVEDSEGNKIYGESIDGLQIAYDAASKPLKTSTSSEITTSTETIPIPNAKTGETILPGITRQLGYYLSGNAIIYSDGIFEKLTNFILKDDNGDKFIYYINPGDKEIKVAGIIVISISGFNSINNLKEEDKKIINDLIANYNFINSNFIPKAGTSSAGTDLTEQTTKSSTTTETPTESEKKLYIQHYSSGVSGMVFTNPIYYYDTSLESWFYSSKLNEEFVNVNLDINTITTGLSTNDQNRIKTLRNLNFDSGLKFIITEVQKNSKDKLNIYLDSELQLIINSGDIKNIDTVFNKINALKPATSSTPPPSDTSKQTPSSSTKTSNIISPDSTPKDTGQKIGEYSIYNYQKYYYLVDNKGEIVSDSKGMNIYGESIDGLQIAYDDASQPLQFQEVSQPPIPTTIPTSDSAQQITPKTQLTPKATTSPPVTTAEVQEEEISGLSLDSVYDDTKKVNFLLNGVSTKLYLEKGIIYLTLANKNEIVGYIESDLASNINIILLEEYKTQITAEIGADNYEILKNSIIEGRYIFANINKIEVPEVNEIKQENKIEIPKIFSTRKGVIDSIPIVIFDEYLNLMQYEVPVYDKNLVPELFCARYAIFVAKDLFGFKYNRESAWNMQYNNKVIKELNEEEKKDPNILWNLYQENILFPGMIVCFENFKSQYIDSKDIKGNPVKCTHVALFLGMGYNDIKKQADVYFAHEFYDKTMISSGEDFFNLELYPVQILDTPDSPIPSLSSNEICNADSQQVEISLPSVDTRTSQSPDNSFVSRDQSGKIKTFVVGMTIYDINRNNILEFIIEEINPETKTIATTTSLGAFISASNFYVDKRDAQNALNNVNSVAIAPGSTILSSDFYNKLINAIKKEEFQREGSGFRTFAKKILMAMGQANTYGEYQFGYILALKMLNQFSKSEKQEFSNIAAKNGIKINGIVDDSTMIKFLETEEGAQFFVRKIIDGNFKILKSYIRLDNNICSFDSLSNKDLSFFAGASYNGGPIPPIVSGFQYSLYLAGVDVSSIPILERFDGYIGENWKNAISQWLKQRTSISDKELEELFGSKNIKGTYYPSATSNILKSDYFSYFVNDYRLNTKEDCFGLIMPNDIIKKTPFPSTRTKKSALNYGYRVSQNFE